MSILLTVFIILVVAVVALYLIGSLPDARLANALRIIVVVGCLIWLAYVLLHGGVIR